MLPGEITAEARWLSHVSLTGGPEGTCHPWTGRLSKGGYGQFWDGTYRAPGRPRMVNAHRWGYRHFVAEPGKLHVRHTCDFRPCQNREHWILGTNSQNVSDREARGRGVVPINFGANNPNTTLTEEIIIAIRVMRAQPGETNVSVARAFGLKPQAVSKIVHRVTWGHVA